MIEEVFGEQFYRITVDEKVKTNLKKEINEELKEIKKDNSIKETVFGSWKNCKVSSTYFKNTWLTNYDSINYDILVEIIKKEFQQILENQKAHFEDIIVQPPWMNVYKTFDFQEPHDHIGDTTQFSCIYFAQYDPKCDAKLYFMNPKMQIHTLIGMDKIMNNKNYKGTFYPEMVEGQLLIFPSYMYHGVSVQNCDDNPRITIAANISIVY